MSSFHDRIERNLGEFDAVEHQGNQATRADDLDFAVLATIFDRRGFTVHKDASAGDVDDPVDRNPCPGIGFERVRLIGLEAGHGDFDEDADILGAGIT